MTDTPTGAGTPPGPIPAPEPTRAPGIELPAGSTADVPGGAGVSQAAAHEERDGAPVPRAPQGTFAEMVRAQAEVPDDVVVKPANWFLEAGAFATPQPSAPASEEPAPAVTAGPRAKDKRKSAPTGRSRAEGTRKRRKGDSPASGPSRSPFPSDGDALQALAGGSPRGGRPTFAYGLLLVAVFGIVGGILKMTVLAGTDGPVPGRLALSGKLDCPEQAPARAVRRFERQTTSEEWRGADDVKRIRIRFVDNQLKSYIERLDQSSEASDLVIEGRRFLANESTGWDESVLDPQRLDATFALPFESSFVGAKLLDESTIDTTPVCYYTMPLGEVTAPDGSGLADAQLELYTDRSGSYRRMRVRGEIADAMDAVAASTEATASTPAAEAARGRSYVLTVDFAEAPAFLPNPPAKLTTSF